MLCYGAILHCDNVASQVLPLDHLQSLNVRRSEHIANKELTASIKAFIERAYRRSDTCSIRWTILYFDRNSALRGLVSTN